MQSDLKKAALWLVFGGTTAALAVPLLTNSGFFFPFITTKAFIFRVVVQLMLLGYLYLAYADEDFRPRWNWLLTFLSLFIGTAFISSILGANFYHGFWGDMERSEGLLMWLHLWAFLFVLFNAIKTRENWHRLIDFSLAVALLVSLFGVGQALGLESILNTSGTRVASTIGNPAFFAGYLLFHIAFALYMLWQRKNSGARVYYTALTLLFVWLVFATQTRGAVLGLGVGLFVSGLLLAVFAKDQPKLRKASAGLVVLVVLLAGIIFLGRNQSWVKNNSYLQRLATISVQSRTAETRLLTWQAGLAGFKEKPIVGWGLENFGQVFNENFPPKIYEDEGSVVWFDRAHNLVVERLATTGILGLLTFLAFLFYPLYRLWRYGLKNSETLVPSVIMIGLIAAYFIQDLFVFETTVTFVLLFFTYAFLSSQYISEGRPIAWLSAPVPLLSLLVIFGIALVPLQWFTNIYPAKVNRAAAAAIRFPENENTFFDKVEAYQKVLAKGTYGLPEYRLQFIEFVGAALASAGGAVNEPVFPVLEYADGQADRQVEHAPEDAKNWLLRMRHYNYTYVSLPDKEQERIETALSYYPDLVRLTPTRPRIHQEAGFSNQYLYRLYRGRGETERAGEYLDQAIEFFEKTIELNPAVVESYIHPINLLAEAGRIEQMDILIKQMQEQAPGHVGNSHLQRLMSIMVQRELYDYVVIFAEELARQNPDNPDAWTEAAVANAYAGNTDRALELAEKIKSFGGQYEEGVAAFIDQINSGFYENPPE